MRAGNVEIEIRQSVREFVKQARPIKARDLNHRELVGKRIVDQHFRGHGEGADAAAAPRVPLGHDVG